MSKQNVTNLLLSLKVEKLTCWTRCLGKYLAIGYLKEIFIKISASFLNVTQPKEIKMFNPYILRFGTWLIIVEIDCEKTRGGLEGSAARSEEPTNHIAALLPSPATKVHKSHVTRFEITLSLVPLCGVHLVDLWDGDGGEGQGGQVVSRLHWRRPHGLPGGRVSGCLSAYNFGVFWENSWIRPRPWSSFRNHSNKIPQRDTCSKVNALWRDNPHSVAQVLQRVVTLDNQKW